ncbi:oxaloacetate decarboxylase [Alteromonas sediminis]|uniref:Oxaloacetate decarboxylase gamma chain n=1 Tax=Alteromonas sediminis TaxID=2259342 RepID=A0A3N5Y929_9ALTE|nr:OadG family transporter subunit [Alteromonas sediminis]RPJ65035.1 oxaloacetate decarboxylase [Alteromonas sediminis]
METNAVTAQLTEAATLMFVGMVVVFVFLAILIVAVKALTWFCNQIPQNNNNKRQETESSTMTMAETQVLPEHIAAITAAIALHHKKTL